MSEAVPFPEAIHTEGPGDFVGDENYFYDMEVDIDWVISWDVPPPTAD